MSQYYAQVHKGLVAHVVEGDPTGRFDPRIKWYPCRATTQVGDIYIPEKGVFYESELTLDEEKKLTLEYINRVGRGQMKLLTKDFDETEILTWPTQVEEAEMLLVNPEADAIFLRTLAKKRKLELPILVARVMYQTKAFRYASALIIGDRQRFEDLVKGCLTLDQLNMVRRQIEEWQLKGSSEE